MFAFRTNAGSTHRHPMMSDNTAYATFSVLNWLLPIARAVRLLAWSIDTDNAADLPDKLTANAIYRAIVAGLWRFGHSADIVPEPHSHSLARAASLIDAVRDARFGTTHLRVSYGIPCTRAYIVAWLASWLTGQPADKRPQRISADALYALFRGITAANGMSHPNLDDIPANMLALADRIVFDSLPLAGDRFTTDAESETGKPTDVDLSVLPTDTVTVVSVTTDDSTPAVAGALPAPAETSTKKIEKIP